MLKPQSMPVTSLNRLDRILKSCWPRISKRTVNLFLLMPEAKVSVMSGLLILAIVKVCRWSVMQWRRPSCSTVSFHPSSPESLSIPFRHLICASGSVGQRLCVITVDASVIADKLYALRPDKSAGDDNLSPRLLRDLSTELLIPVSLIFRRSLDTSCVPKLENSYCFSSV